MDDSKREMRTGTETVNHISGLALGLRENAIENETRKEREFTDHVEEVY
jgi:cysteine sulfinate desulfinase/cysteine desulfurase-like protein